MPDEILTLAEVAQLLKVADKTLYTMAQRGEVPPSRSADSGASNVTISTSGWSSRSYPSGTTTNLMGSTDEPTCSR